MTIHRNKSTNCGNRYNKHIDIETIYRYFLIIESSIYRASEKKLDPLSFHHYL